MSEYTEELDVVFGLLSTVDYGIGYSDNTGKRLTELQYTKEFLISEVDGGLVNPFQAMREEFEDQIVRDYQTLMAGNPTEAVFTTNGVEYVRSDPEFKVRTAVMYRRELPLRDTYEFWLSLTV